jgi:hypothetical protein
MRIEDQKVADQDQTSILEAKSISLNTKKRNGELTIWRTKMQARVQGRVQLKDSICSKCVQIGS